MASRLPTVGGDDGNWGSVLNQFLQQGHNTDGTLKNNITPGTVQTTATDAVINTLNRYDATSGNLAPSAPAVGAAGTVYEAMKTDSSTNTVTIGGETLSGQGDTVTFVSDGSSWISGGVRTTRTNQSSTYSGRGTLATVATQYVSTTGSDSADGLSWSTAKLTVQAAIDALPANGGIVEIGYGTFSSSTPIVIANTQSGVTLRGRGMGQSYDATTNVLSPVSPTTLENTGTGDALQITGPTTLSPSGGDSQQGVIIEDLAIVGNATSTNGITAVRTPRIALRRIVLYLHAGYGLAITDSYWINLDTVHCVKNGLVGATASGGFITGQAGPSNTGLNALLAQNCIFNANYGHGVVLAASAECNVFINCDFSRNLSNASVTARGVAPSNGGPYVYYGCYFEGNAGYGYRPNSAGGVHHFSGCRFSGNATQVNAISPVASTDRYTVMNCRFDGHTGSSASIENTNGAFILLQNNYCQDTTFVLGPTSGQNIPASAAPGVINHMSMFTHGVTTQTLSSNGAVTINALYGDIAQVTLQANATSSSISNPTVGQILTIIWVQDATGARTYAWPTNCKFAGGTAPSDTTASKQTSTTFRYDGTNWQEISRSVAVG